MQNASIKTCVKPLGVFMVALGVFWCLVGRTLSYRVYTSAGEFLYNAAYSPFTEMLLSMVYALIYMLAIYLLFRLPKTIAWLSVSVFTVIVLCLAILNWLGGVRPDVQVSDRTDVLLQGGNINHADTKNTYVKQNLISYTDAGLGVHIQYPASISISKISSTTRQTLIGPVDMSFPKDSIHIPEVFIISRVPYTSISKQNSIVDWHSCCSGVRYWYEQKQKTWNAEEFSVLNPGSVSESKKEEIKIYPLNIASSSCVLREQLGKNSFYKIVSTEEGVPIDISYYLMTDQGYAIRFSTDIDLSDMLEGDVKANTMKHILETAKVDIGAVVESACR